VVSRFHGARGPQRWLPSTLEELRSIRSCDLREDRHSLAWQGQWWPARLRVLVAGEPGSGDLQQQRLLAKRCLNAGSSLHGVPDRLAFSCASACLHGLRCHLAVLAVRAKSVLLTVQPSRRP